MIQKFTIIFDLDGTLVDTAPDLMLAHNYVMKKFGYKTKTFDEIRSLFGKGAANMINKSIWGTAKNEFNQIETKELKQKMAKEFIKYYGDNILVESKLYKGVETFLKWCKKNNISMAVCTNKTERLAVDLLKKIGVYDYLEYVAGHDTFNYNKPDPKHLTNILDIIGGDIKKTIMIGDSEVDSNTAYNASVPFILLEAGYTDKKANQIKHDHLIKDFIGLDKIILDYLND